jgi:hypothetical protein
MDTDAAYTTPERTGHVQSDRLGRAQQLPHGRRKIVAGDDDVARRPPHRATATIMTGAATAATPAATAAIPAAAPTATAADVADLAASGKDGRCRP